MTPLEELRAALDAVVVGQEEAKTGLLLALLAREHAYLVGPPGSGKTLLAEALASASGARVAGVRFHRDLRDSDLLGDAVLRIRRSEGAERLEIGIEPGALLRAEVAVLDDISRAPGEALGPLLRILAERAAPGGPIPLETAIATSSPPGDEVCADPLEPSQLDRFAIQVRMHGLVTGKDWAGARELLERAPAPGIEPVLDPDTRLELQARAAALPVAAEARAALVRLALRLAEIVSTEEASLISDRAFAIVAQRVMRAHALLREAPQADVIDLEAVRFMLAFRVPEEVQRAFSMLVDEVLHEEPPRSETMTGVERASGQVGGEASGGASRPANWRRTRRMWRGWCAPSRGVSIADGSRPGAIPAGSRAAIARWTDSRRSSMRISWTRPSSWTGDSRGRRARTSASGATRVGCWR
jgi:MoxR-like ATPase